MEYSSKDISDIVTLLQLIPSNGEGIGWYLIERVLARRNHSISLEAKLMILLNEMESAGFIKSKQTSESVHPVYLMTDKGKVWLDKHILK